jgi:flavin-dependent dehydrogenase
MRELRRTRLLRSLLPNAAGPTGLTARPAGSLSFEAAAGRGWLALGDAAFAPDPLSGMGIEFAVESAGRAAAAVGGADPAFADFGRWVADWSAEHDAALAVLRPAYGVDASSSP